MTVILFSISISLFCLGLYVITGEGMILYFLRKPFDRNYDKLELIKERKKAGFTTNMAERWRRTLVNTLLTPVIGCVICYSSFWTIIWHGFYYGYSEPLLIIHEMFMVAFLNAFLVALYDRI